MNKQDKNKRFYKVHVVEDGTTVTKLDIPDKFLRKLDLKGKITLAEFNKLLWRQLYVIPDQETEKLLQDKGLIK